MELPQPLLTDLNNLIARMLSEVRRRAGQHIDRVPALRRQSLRDGGMPFRPTLKTWDEMTAQEISAKLAKSEADIREGRVFSQEDVDVRMKERLAHGNTSAI